MKASNDHSAKLARQIFILVAVFAAVFSLLFSSRLSGAQSPDGRPRRTGLQPAATPTPTPANVPSQTPAPRTTATPAPTPKGKTAPALGEAPPPPKLKPKPTPTPSQEIDPDTTIKINTGLVPLNVRVIDRNNRPIDNVRQNEFHVFEDGVPQPIFDFSREEVPISYGLAVDTSGSLRTQLTSVIDTAKTIINSNKAGAETFPVPFISSDKIETVPGITASKDLLLDGLENLYVEGGQTAIIDAVYLSAEHVAE